MGSIVPHFAYMIPSFVMSIDGVGVGVILFIPPVGVGTGILVDEVGVGVMNGHPDGIGV